MLRWRRSRSPASWIALVTLLCLAVAVGVARADGGTTTAGLSDPSQPLIVDPSADPQATGTVELSGGTRVFFIGAMPKSMTIDHVTSGDFARDSACTQSPPVELKVYEYTSGSGLDTGSVVAQSTDTQPFGPDLGRVTWTLHPTDLADGHAYGFFVESADPDCQQAIERSWAHNSATVDGGPDTCATLQDPDSNRWRLWHTEGQTDSGSCSLLGSLLNFDPSLPTGWTQVDRSGSGDAVNTSSGQCATELGATEQTAGSSQIVCQYPQFTAPGTATPDGWYYGLPWSGPGLDGSPRDLYLRLDPAAPPTATTGDASDVTSVSATLNGTVNPERRATSYHFEWGADTSYGNAEPAQDVDAGSGVDNVAATASLTGLDPGTTYHFRLVATTANAPAAYGEDHTVTTVAAPTATQQPTISGDAVDAETLTADAGEWDQAIAETGYQWQSCDSQGASCADIEDATDSTYDLQGADVGSTLRVVVTVTSAQGGQATATSEPTAVIKHEPPVIIGVPKQDETLTVTPGGWDQTPTSIRYQWSRCDTAGESCADIVSARATHYLLGAADVGTTLRVRVSVTFADGTSASATSTPTTTVDPASPPANTTAPAISGPAKQGELTIADPGAWTDATAYSYQWRRCDSSGGECTDIDGATTSVHLIDENDVGSALRVIVTASGPGGSASATAPPSAPVEAQPAPTNTTPPSIGGTAIEGGTLAARAGSWDQPLTDVRFQWQSCDSHGANCADVEGGAGAGYGLGEGDVGTRLRVVVTATSAGGSATAISPASDVVAAAAPPRNISTPRIYGDAVLGTTLSGDPGSWLNAAAGGFSYQWQRCDLQYDSCGDIDGATGRTHAVGSSDAGFSLRLVVSAVGPGGTATASSDPTSAVESLLPANTSPPTIAGEPTVGAGLDADEGHWVGATDYSYQWERCDAHGDNCVYILDATWWEYALDTVDLGTTIRVVVSATGPGGSVSLVSPPTAVIGAPSQPVNTSPPRLSYADPNVNGVILVDDGSWAGAAYNIQFRWERCDVDGQNCADITPPDTWDPQLRVATADDVGHTLRVRAIASNGAGSTTVTTDPTAVITGLPPANTSPPTATGDPFPGGWLLADAGTWEHQGETWISYQWQSCDPQGENCADIDGATEVYYDIGPGDVGSSARVVVSYAGPDGPVSAVSQPAVITDAPVPTWPSPPVLEGEASEGSAIYVASLDPPTGDPYEWISQWQRCDVQGQNCTDIDGATDWEYTLGADDVGGTVRFSVTGNGYGGSATTVSQPLGVVVAADAVAPTNLAPPSISGQAASGQRLSVASAGVWSPDSAAYAYQWQRCDQDGQDCRDIPGATDDSYQLTTADIEQTVRLTVTATTSGGTAQATSGATAIVGPPTNPVNLMPPSIQGSAVEGRTLALNVGYWQTSTIANYRLRWQRCDSSGANCQAVGSNDDDYAYRLGAADLGATIRVVVTATAQGSNASATTPATATVSAAPAPHQTASPTIQGSTAVGATLHANPGSWDDADNGFVYQWQRCDTHGGNCTDIAGATGADYTVAQADTGTRLRIAVTAAGPGGTTTAPSDASDVIADPAAPDALVAPTINGTAREGETLTADRGGWSGVSLAYTYQWQACD
ncbi:MAG: hypothetical protein ACJ768_14505, partial [Gaiellaceae bacterium]